MVNSPALPLRNRLLSKISAAELQQIRSHIETVELKRGETVHELGKAIGFVYFPERCILSALNTMADGRVIEAATVGYEGASGVSVLLEVPDSIHRVIAQAHGASLRIRADVLKREAIENDSLRKRLLQYANYFSAQISASVACNGLHPIQTRCCRWLLMTHDRQDSDEITLTHEYLSYMLGVRRAGVTEVLLELGKKGVIECSRGRIMVTDRPGLEALSCECYQNVKQLYERLLG